MNASPKEPVTDNIPVYAVSTKRKRGNNNTSDEQDNQQRSQTNTMNTSSATENPPEYALSNKGNQNASTLKVGTGPGQQSEGVYNYAFVPVSVNLENGDQRPVIKEAKIVAKSNLAGQQH